MIFEKRIWVTQEWVKSKGAAAALPPDVRKGFAFPDVEQPPVTTMVQTLLKCTSEGPRPSAHQAAQPRTFVSYVDSNDLLT